MKRTRDEKSFSSVANRADILFSRISASFRFNEVGSKEAQRKAAKSRNAQKNEREVRRASTERRTD